MLNDLVLIHYLGNQARDPDERSVPITEGVDRDFVCGVEYGRECAAHFAGASRLVKRGKLGQVRRLEVQPAKRGEVGLHTLARRAAPAK